MTEVQADLAGYYFIMYAGLIGLLGVAAYIIINIILFFHRRKKAKLE